MGASAAPRGGAARVCSRPQLRDRANHSGSFSLQDSRGDLQAQQASTRWLGAVCIHARITEGDSGATDLCKFEVGLPLRNEEQGDVPEEMAQQVAARTANRAAHTVLAEARQGEMIAVLCLRFKDRYERMLKEEIDGARVSQCETEGIETVYFDIPGGLVP